MKDRSKSARRILEVQRQLHRIEELEFAQVQQRLAKVEQEQAELTEAFSEDGALQSLFIDMTVRRIVALRQEEGRIALEKEAKARRLVAHAGRLKIAERLAEDLEVEMRRAGERRELEAVLEVTLARTGASLKQDR